MISVSQLLLCLALLPTGFAWGQTDGYDVQDNQIRVNTRAHWQSWRVAVGAAAITPDGTISPRFLRKQINAALDAEQYGSEPQGGAVAGSNDGSAALIMDGDLATSWGPDLDDPSENWWVQLRLGRVVVVDSVVLHFVDEDQGEPFLQFDVMGWRRPPPLAPSANTITGTGISALWVIYRTDRPNKDQRRISFVPRTTDQANDEFGGDPLEVIHILITGSELDRLREVADITYEGLPAESRGAIDYYRLSTSGRQTLTSADAYAALPPARQGAIRYYSRERPRLAEVEVWTAGDNLNLGLVNNGAVTTMQTGRAAEPKNLASTVTDGDFSTGPSSALFSGEYLTFYEDLGTLFWIDELHFLSHDLGNSPYEFNIDLSDGTLAPDGSILWRPAAADRQKARFRSFRIEPSRVRYIRTRARTRSGTTQMSLIETLLYGEGYVAVAHLTSDVIDLGGRKGLVTIEWDADTPEGTSLEISTRTGNVLAEEQIFHDSDGRVVTEDRWRRRLPDVKKGPVTVRLVPGDGFSDWSRPYTKSGEEIRSPRTRRYLQAQVRVVADTTSKYGPPASLSALRINLADLYTDKVTGEIHPTRVQRVGAPEARSYYLEPIFGADDQGFDQIRLVASGSTDINIVEVLAGSRQDFVDGTEQVFGAAQLERASTGMDTLALLLPRALRRETELVEVRMQTTIHGNSVAFEAAVRETGFDDAWQLVEPGDATTLVRSETNVVVALAGNQVMSDLQIDPAVFTPNGDGINDETELVFNVSRVLGAKHIDLAVFDLSGRRVRSLHQAREDTRGAWRVSWPGVDDNGNLLPPGIYLVSLELEAESSRAQNTRHTAVVHMVY